jgi:hypothetical protein
MDQTRVAVTILPTSQMAQGNSDALEWDDLRAVANNLLNAESRKRKSYLEDRHQRVKLVNNDLKSCASCGIVKHGVSQG